MPSFEQVAWFPLCAGLTVAGLIATWVLWRRRGAASGLRMAAWSLLPLAAYLTGVVSVLWTIGTEIAGWVLRLVISPMVWAGVALVGVSVVAWVVSGVLRRQPGKEAPAGRTAPESAAVGASASEGRAATSGRDSRAVESSGADSGTGGEDLSDVEEILRRRGIT